MKKLCAILTIVLLAVLFVATIVRADTTTISLGAGWNLISLPLKPSDTNISAVMSSISGKYAAIYAYDSASASYKSYIPGASSNTLSTVELGRGYWVFMNSASTLTVNGTPTSEGVALTIGWNLVGYNSTTERPIGAALNSVNNMVTAVYAFNNAANSYEGYAPPLNALSTMSPGRGYWIYATGNATWTLPATNPSPTPTPGSPGVVFDIDLTKGPSSLPPQAKVVGGTWDNGWRVTGGTKVDPQRIVIDAGYALSHGILEASFTMNQSPVQDGKRNYVGIHENAHLHQSLEPFGDILYARSGKPEYRFSKIKAFVKKWDHTEFEESIGALNDWVTDDKYVHNVKFEWGNGTATFTGPKGTKLTCPKSKCGISPELTLDKLRYVFLGSDEYTGISLKGLRFLKVKLTDTKGTAQ
jgi:hypothetical protein